MRSSTFTVPLPSKSAAVADVLTELADHLAELDTEHARAADVVRLRYVSGLSVSETARALGISDPTVRADWTFARAWLGMKLGIGD